jgi:hypothetical protein
VSAHGKNEKKTRVSPQEHYQRRLSQSFHVDFIHIIALALVPETPDSERDVRKYGDAQRQP